MYSRIVNFLIFYLFSSRKKSFVIRYRIRTIEKSYLCATLEVHDVQSCRFQQIVKRIIFFFFSAARDYYLFSPTPDFVSSSKRNRAKRAPLFFAPFRLETFGKSFPSSFARSDQLRAISYELKMRAFELCSLATDETDL